ncbi:helix-turn-helix domain-containing protein [Rhodobacter capsulatus]|jgi:transcriptional regulator with XRE-family HTH domain|uniref:Transcriptional regulator, XRE family n=1 Tax=Rhodobacter capsulatus (strain ATCC BAA-309 / NBRC 16581 / SB1003) TaxID=272942 RepID=D5ASD4_RHOCB|nr:helix-turn-helix transcriptional regulator [Rhodobacter capsulatus]ADE85025.1 transcriptional regulator, XRE family [Rhodobacter capsulatus SB 1003]ETD02066.1 XRE family transcriptional regulator [Rhodobacter capsulatus DE442]ETD77740.1 XRE family transcriptional regulator [Rhodobacter capsulatus R121]ETE54098.1 XRE family transcriptional regulator [Rhodobacter capsulatus Y262]MDS0926680.1 helix-turn-helix domain-containing protein [Rhodobacter capsulatus]
MPRTIHTEGQRALCEAIAAARREKGLNQADLARELHCQQSLIARIESGERRIDVLEFIKIFRALGVSPAEALRRVGEQIPADQGI